MKCPGMKRRTQASLSLLLALLAGCPPPPPAPKATPAPGPAIPAAPQGPGTPAPAAGTESADEIRPVYAGNPAPTPLAKRICELFHTLPVERQAACCRAAEQPTTFAAECERVVTVALSEKHVSLDEAKLSACEAAYRKQLADCDRVMSNVSPPPEACRGLFQGALAAGAVCRSELECQTGLSCVGLGPTASGRCAPPSPAGAPCHPIVDPLAVYTKQTLDDHPSCASYCNRHQCADFLPPGAACVFDTQCEPKSRCAAKKCIAGKPALGGTCSGLADCPLDATCADGVCKPRGKTGDACQGDAQCLGECDQGAGGGHCGPRCPHAFVPVFSRPPPR